MKIKMQKDVPEVLGKFWRTGQGQPNFELWYAMLFGGERATCCDEVVVLHTSWIRKLATIATISSTGESYSGEPTIVGLYTLPCFRGRGYGQMAMEAAIRRCVERGFHIIRVDVLTPSILKLMSKLPSELKRMLDVRDQSACGSTLPQ